MDPTSLYSFQELSKDLNMTRTAQRLYISQQTLSNHIQRLEQYYGVQLLYRKPSLALTCAGEFVLSFAQVMGKEERNLMDILSDIEHQERGTLRVGASMVRGTHFFPRIIPAFYRRYPRVEVRYVDGLSLGLERQVADGELDFAVVLSGTYSPELVAQELLRDPIYLCVPDGLLQQHYSPQEVRDIKRRSAEGAVLSDFARLPFILMSNRLGGRIQNIFAREKIQPQVIFSAPSTAQTLPLIAKGLAASYCTHMNLVAGRGQLDSHVNIFPLWDQGAPVEHPLSLLRHRQRYLTHFAKYFMELLFQTAASFETTPLRWIVGESDGVEKPVEKV